MNTYILRLIRGREACYLVLAWLLAPTGVFAQSPTASISGRVAHASTGDFIATARITVDATSLETFSDADGYFRLANIPPGNVQLRVFFTGLRPAVETVALAAGATVQRQITLAPLVGEKSTATRDSETVKLGAFVVGTTREMDGAAIAINEQRFAANVKNVVAADEYGQVAEGNSAELLKFLPGVTIDYGGGNARSVMLNGVPSANVPVTVDGFSLASAGVGGTGRAVALDMVSINNISRLEVLHSPTPESQGSALAGSVNMVPRSAFERSRPQLNASVFVMMRDNDRDIEKSPGPTNDPRRKVHPGFDFSYVVPVNQRFGFTVSANNSTQYSPQDYVLMNWRGSSATTNGVAFPHTTPDKPYLTDFSVRDDTKETGRTSFGASLDYKLTAHDRFSFSYQHTYNYVDFMARTLTFAVNRVALGDFTTTATKGAVGQGTMNILNNAINRSNRTAMPTLLWRHDGPSWKIESGLGLSTAANHDRDIDTGFFNNSTVRRSNLTIQFSDIFYLRPGVITVADGTTGAPLNPYVLSSFDVANATANPRDSSDVRKTAYVNARHEFSGALPLALKGGLDFRTASRDTRGTTGTYTFVGKDGRPTATPAPGDDSAVPFLDAPFSERIPPFGFPKIQWVSNELLWKNYQAAPGIFTLDENARYRSIVNLSKRAEEKVTSAYLRADLALIDRRLNLVGGVRAEQTNINAEGPLSDATRNFQRNAAGGFILGSNGRPLAITSDALAASKLTLLDRALHAEKEYLRLFPSLNASFNVRENLIARGAYYYSVGRPDFNQYAGGVTLPDTSVAASSSNQITVSNVGIKAWSARSTKIRLEYYFAGVGQFSVGAFRRDFKNFFGSTTFPATPEFLAQYGIDPTTYGGYEVATQYNLSSTVRMTGLDFEYKQALTFLPGWARGVQVFANGSGIRATGTGAENFAGYIPRSGSWGISLTRERYNVRMHWNYRGRQRRNAVAAGGSIEPGTYNWGSKRLYIDLLGEYNVSKRFALFANLRNLNDATEDLEIAGPSTPAHAQFRQRIDFASLWTFGLRGRF